MAILSVFLSIFDHSASAFFLPLLLGIMGAMGPLGEAAGPPGTPPIGANCDPWIMA